MRKNRNEAPLCQALGYGALSPRPIGSLGVAGLELKMNPRVEVMPMTTDALAEILAQHEQNERDFRKYRRASLRLRDRILSNPRCSKWYRDRRDNLDFWVHLQTSQGALL